MAARNSAAPEKRRLHRSGYANESEVAPTDTPLLDSPGGRESRPDPADILPDTPEDEGAPHRDVRSRPRGDTTGHVGPGNGEETPDGLDETEEAIRQEAEDRPVGQRRSPRQ